MSQTISKDTTQAIKALFKEYPTKQAVLIPALHLVQNASGYVSEAAQIELAHLLDIPPTSVREVVSFYTMFHDKPVGRHVVKICRNLSCQLRGAEKLMKHAQNLLEIDFGQTTTDGRITLDHDECIASCGTGPALWCDDNIVENLDKDKLEKFLAGLK